MSLISPISNSSTFRWLSELISYFMRILARLKRDYYEFFIPPLLLSSLLATLLTRLAPIHLHVDCDDGNDELESMQALPNSTKHLFSRARDWRREKGSFSRTFIVVHSRDPQINSTQHTLRARCCFTLFTKRAQRDKQVLSRTRTSPAWFLEFDRKKPVFLLILLLRLSCLIYVYFFKQIFLCCVVFFFPLACVLKLLHFLLLSYGLNGTTQHTTARAHKRRGDDREGEWKKRRRKIIYNKTWFTQNSKNTFLFVRSKCWKFLSWFFPLLCYVIDKIWSSLVDPKKKRSTAKFGKSSTMCRVCVCFFCDF